jgi:hypothetical protein
VELQLGLCALAVQDMTGKTPDTVRAHFLAHEDGIEELPVTNELLEKARQTLAEHNRKTASSAFQNYPCVCGGKCERDFIFPDGFSLKNGERPGTEESAIS